MILSQKPSQNLFHYKRIGSIFRDNYKIKDRVTRTPLKTGGELKICQKHYYKYAQNEPTEK
jgi:hypothetical protein